MTENKIDIGVLEEKNTELLHPKFFPSKVGGKPAWLDLQNLPTPAELTCNLCKDPLIFLCQVYAPNEDSEDGFHRTIFIFICRNGGCCRTNSSENYVVLRCQLRRENNFYSFEPCEENDDVDISNKSFSMDKWPKLCELCGSRAPSHCAKCKKIFYCSRKHQILDWQKGHKEKCASLKDAETVKFSYFLVTPAGKQLLFKEWDLVVDEEDEEGDSKLDENQEMEKLKRMIQEKKAGSLSGVSDTELEQYTGNVPEDKVFSKFSKRIARHPDQVLRYDKGGIPLWITGGGAGVTHIPNCEYCGRERQFEFQIMPQLLNFIDVGIELNSIDWGVLAVYTCKQSCSDGPSYKTEFLIKQDLSQ